MSTDTNELDTREEDKHRTDKTLREWEENEEELMKQEICHNESCQHHTETVYPNGCRLWADINDCEYVIRTNGVIKACLWVAFLFFAVMVGVPALWGIIIYFVPNLDEKFFKILNWAACLKGCRG